MGHRAIPSSTRRDSDMRTPRGAGLEHARGACLSHLHPSTEGTDAGGTVAPGPWVGKRRQEPVLVPPPRLPKHEISTIAFPATSGSRDLCRHKGSHRR